MEHKESCPLGKIQEIKERKCSGLALVINVFNFMMNRVPEPASVKGIVVQAQGEQNCTLQPIIV